MYGLSAGTNGLQEVPVELCDVPANDTQNETSEQVCASCVGCHV